MQAVQLNVAGVVPPKDPTWKNALVKDTNGIEYNVSTSYQAYITSGPLNALIEPPQGQGRRWKIIGINGQPFQPFQPQAQAPMPPQAPYAPAQQPMQPVASAVPQLQPPPPAPPMPAVDGKEVSMFVMSVLGKAFEGTGQVPGKDELESMVRACRQAYLAGMKDLPPEAPFDDGLPEQMG